LECGGSAAAFEKYDPAKACAYLHTVQKGGRNLRQKARSYFVYAPL
jgi:hypothetical protein